MTIRFHANADKPQAATVQRELTARAAELGLAVTRDGAADAVIVLGGDGTFLRAAHEFPGVPLLGFNLGALGYLSSVEESDFAQALAMLAGGQFRISERTLVSADGKHAALNDIVVTRELGGHAALLDLEADGNPVTRYMADGLIFATPTGSTAYSLAAGGPVLTPGSASLVVTPVSPHALGVRPLVVHDSVRFTVTARTRTPGNEVKLGVYADGVKVMALGEGDSVRIAKADAAAKLIELSGYDPYAVLARKLGWSGSNLK